MSGVVEEVGVWWEVWGCEMGWGGGWEGVLGCGGVGFCVFKQKTAYEI